jgi:hypothetical protein
VGGEVKVNMTEKLNGVLKSEREETGNIWKKKTFHSHMQWNIQNYGS